MRILVWAFFALLPIMVNAQDSAGFKLSPQTAGNLSDQTLYRISKSYGSINAELQQASSSILDRAQQEEFKLQRALLSKDSLASGLFASVPKQYAQLQAKLKSPVDLTVKDPLQEYIPSFDSLQTALRFLEQSGLAGLPASKLNQLQGLSGQLTSVETRLRQANEVKTFIQSRRDQLQGLLSQYNLTDKLSRLNKQVYYYQQSIAQYKSLWQNKDQLAVKILSVVRKLPAFAGFMQNHSYLSQLFRVPGSTVDLPDSAGLPGLQTRRQVSALVAAKLGPGASFPGAVTGGNNGSGNPLGAGMQDAQAQLDSWKDKITQSGGGSSSDPTADFIPNTQHGKPIWRRLEAGINLQSVNSSAFVPATSDLALTLGYKLNDKAIIGIGAAYKMGWGQPFNHISLSSQGMGLRSFMEVEWKHNFWWTGGLEYNYYNAFNSFSQLGAYSSWQSSGLVGMTKKFKIGKRQNEIQLLYDVLHAQHVPTSQPLVFRVGYAL
jgi:hypothetical protein